MNILSTLEFQALSANVSHILGSVVALPIAFYLVLIPNTLRVRQTTSSEFDYAATFTP